MYNGYFIRGLSLKMWMNVARGSLAASTTVSTHGDHSRAAVTTDTTWHWTESNAKVFCIEKGLRSDDPRMRICR